MARLVRVEPREHIMTKAKLPTKTLKIALKFAKEYFLESNERHSALLLLMGIILGVVALVALNYLMALSFAGFWEALTAMSWPLYIESMETLVVLIASIVGVSTFKDYLVDVLTISWREWLTNNLVNKYTSGETYLKLSRHFPEIDHPEQRIQEDAHVFVKYTISLSMDFLQSILTQASFLRALWVVGGAITFVLLGASITIPGYLVWIAILFAAVSSALTHIIGRSLAKLSHHQNGLEADFREDMESLNNDAESVAQEHGGVYYKQSITSKFQAICKNSFDMVRVKIKVTAFNSYYLNMLLWFPYIVAAPLYFAGKTTLGKLMEIGTLFGQVLFSLNWFSNSYEDIATYKASVVRVDELENAMQEGSRAITSKSIVVHEGKTKELSIRKLNIADPSSTKYMMRELNLTFTPGENTLIKGRSGLGKSTLFKVMAGTWLYGDGEVSVPNHHKLCFLPQKPSIRNDTLKAVLAYPESADTYTDEQYEVVLRAVGGEKKYMDKFVGELNTKKAWSKCLSGGEQQRISFARALLKKPGWLFLDESTSALDEESEDCMYGLVGKQLKDTTFISIGHRSTVKKFHSRVVTFDADEDGTILLQYEHRLVDQSIAVVNDDDFSAGNSLFVKQPSC